MLVGIGGFFISRRRNVFNGVHGRKRVWLWLVLARTIRDDKNENEVLINGKTGAAYQRFSELQIYLELIRNETPILVTFDVYRKSPGFVVLCGSEPTGEGEI